MPDREVSRINATSADSTKAYLERSSITYLECAVQLMLTHMSKQRVVETLRQQARIVEEFD